MVSGLPATDGALERSRQRITAALDEDARRPAASLLDALAEGFAVYGAGSMGRDVMAALARRALRPRLVLDRRRARGAVCGVPLRHPADEAISRAERASLTVVVAVFSADADPREIRELLEREGYGRTIGFVELYGALAQELGDRYWLTSHELYHAHADEIAAGLELWADDESRELYASVVAARLSGDDRTLPRPSLDHQYFPASLPPLPSPIRLVDCGACTGDTLAAALALGLHLDAACAFESDPENFRALAAWARRRPASADFPLSLWPCAVGAVPGAAPFRSGQGSASGFSGDGAVSVPVVALDDVIPDFPATLLKLDLAGAEAEALAGAAALIRQWRPRLAVCVSHRPEHLWTIPRLVRQEHPAYDLLLRLHRFNAFDLVMYALPRT